MGYVIRMSDVDAAYDSFLAYAHPSTGMLTQALEKLREAVRELTVMRTFQGQAAEAIKSYFGDAYPVIIDQIECLAGQLRSDFALKYMNRYADQPIAEQGQAVLPEDEMEAKRGLLAFAKDSRIPTIQQYLDKAKSALPSGVAFTFPSTLRLQGALNGAHGEIEQIKNSMRVVEEAGCALFAADQTDWSLFAAQLKNTIACRCVMDMTLYDPGDFFKHIEVIFSTRSFAASLHGQNDSNQALIAAERQWASRQLLKEEEAYRICEEGRAQWELIGIGAGVAIVLVGAFATVTAGAPLAALVAGAAALKAGKDLAERIQDRAANRRSSASDDWDGKGVSVPEAATATGVKIASKIGSNLVKQKPAAVRNFISQQVKGTVSVVDVASSSVQSVADCNHERMRTEAQGHLARIEELKKYTTSLPSKAA